MRDEESESLWDHITGECFEGPLEGQRMTFWAVSITTVGAELARDGDAVLLKSDYRTLKTMAMKTVMGKVLDVKKEGTFLAPHFRASMSDDIDPRLPEGEQGLGLMTDDFVGKFYPTRLLRDGPVEDVWQGRQIRIVMGEIDHIPHATFTESGQKPMQLLSRWYGFAFTCPGCEIFGGEQ